MMDFFDFDFDDSGVSGDLNEIRVIIYKPEEKPDENFQYQVLNFLRKGNYEQVEDKEKHEDNTEVWVNRKGE